MRGGGFETSNLALQQICGAYRVECDRWWDFRGGIRTRRIGSPDIADIQFSTCAVIRDRRDQHYRGDHYFLVFQVDGCSRMRQRGSEALLLSRDCTLIDSRYPSVFETPNGFRQYSFHLPAPALHEHFGRRAIPLARRIEGDHGAGRVLSDMLTSFLRNAETLEGVELTSLTLQLLGTALGLDKGVEASLPRTVSASDIVQYIDGHLREPNLTPLSIAENFDVSLRQLYRIVMATSLTPAALIWKRRLERARAQLEQP